MPYNPERHQRHSIRLAGYDYTAAGAYFVTICTHNRLRLFDDSRFRRIAEQQMRRHTMAGARGKFPGRVWIDEWIVMPDHIHAIIVIGDDARDARDARGDGDARDDGDGGDARDDGDGGDDARDARGARGARDARDDGDGGGDDAGAQQQPARATAFAIDGCCCAPPRHTPSHDTPTPSHDAPTPSHDAPTPSHDTPTPSQSANDIVFNAHIESLIGKPIQRILETNVTPGSLGAIVRSYKAAVSRRINSMRKSVGAEVWQRNYWEWIIRDSKAMQNVQEYIRENPQRHVERHRKR